MIKNSDFYAKNRRFAKRIEYYNRCLLGADVSSELWALLWVLQSSGTEYPDKYIFACLRNRFFDLLKNQSLKYCLPFDENLEIATRESAENIDLRIDIKNAMEYLTEEEKRFIYRHFIAGERFSEIGDAEGTTRQAVSQKAKRICAKLKKHLT